MENEVRVKVVPRSKRVAFTGYRPQKMPFGFDEQDERCVDFKKRLHDTIESFIWQGYQHFISGGALGMDMYAAEAVLDLKAVYPFIRLILVLPCRDQTRGWAEEDVKRYHAKWAPEYRQRHDALFDKADIVTATGHQYTKSCMFARNRYLVDNADMLLAAYDGQPGGTQMTVQYARQMGIQVCMIPPVTSK